MTELPVPFLQLEKRSPVALYLQVADALRTMLVAGGFSAGEFLPPVRKLASQVQVHHNTIAQAYRVLAGEGWLQLRRHHGAKVLDRRLPDAAAAQASARFSRDLRNLAAKAIASGVPISAVSAELRNLGGALAEEPA